MTLKIISILLTGLALTGTVKSTEWTQRHHGSRNHNASFFNPLGLNFPNFQPLLPPSNLFQSPFLYQSSQFFQPQLVNFPTPAAPPFLWNFNQQQSLSNFNLTGHVTAVPLLEPMKPVPVKPSQPPIADSQAAPPSTGDDNFKPEPEKLDICGSLTETKSEPGQVSQNPFQKPCISVSDFLLEMPKEPSINLMSQDQSSVPVAFEKPPSNPQLNGTGVSDLTLEWSKESFQNNENLFKERDPFYIKDFNERTDSDTPTINLAINRELYTVNPELSTDTVATIFTSKVENELEVTTSIQPSIYRRSSLRRTGNKSLIHMPRRIQIQQPTRKSSGLKRNLNRRERIIKIAALSNAKPLSSKMRKLPSDPSDSKVLSKHEIYKTNDRRPKLTLPTKKIVPTTRGTVMPIVMASQRTRMAMKRKLDNSKVTAA